MNHFALDIINSLIPFLAGYNVRYGFSFKNVRVSF